MSTWPVYGKTPLFITHWIRGYKTTADTQQVKILEKSGASLHTSSGIDLPTSAGYEYLIRTLAPDDQAWSVDNINTLSIGVEQVNPV